MELLPIRNNLKITDLGFDCVEYCLRHLSIEELLNVADSNTELKYVARSIFRRMYRGETIYFTETLKFRNGNPHCECDRLSFSPRSFLAIHELKLSLQFFRCFGDFVSEISFKFCPEESSSVNCQFFLNHQIEFDKAQERQHKIIEYINEFCADSLREIGIEKHYFDHVNCDLDKLVKPFKNVETIAGNIFLNTQLKLHEIFPKVRTISMNTDKSFINEHTFLHNNSMSNCFPYLEHLWINIDHPYKYKKENFAIALRLSTKIKTLGGNIWFDVLFDPNNFRLWNSTEHFDNLEQLNLEVNLQENRHFIEILNTPVSEDLHLKNLKELNIKFINGIVQSVDTWIFPCTCDNLRSLSLSAIQCRFKRFSNLLNKHPTVKKFKFNCNKGQYTPTLYMDDCTIIAKAFPLLEEIIFETTPENVVRAVEMMPLLKHFQCYVRHIERIADIKHLHRSFNGWVVLRRFFNVISFGEELLLTGKRE